MKVFNSFAEARRRIDKESAEIFMIDKIKYRWKPIMKDGRVDRFDIEIVKEPPYEKEG